MEERQRQGRTQNLFGEPSRKRGKNNEGLSREVRLSGTVTGEGTKMLRYIVGL